MGNRNLKLHVFWVRQRELGQGQSDYPCVHFSGAFYHGPESSFQFHKPYFFNSATVGGLLMRHMQSMFSQCMTAGEKQQMKYIPFSEGNRTLKNKYTCKPYHTSESIHLFVEFP